MLEISTLLRQWKNRSRTYHTEQSHNHHLLKKKWLGQCVKIKKGKVHLVLERWFYFSRDTDRNMYNLFRILKIVKNSKPMKEDNLKRKEGSREKIHFFDDKKYLLPSQVPSRTSLRGTPSHHSTLTQLQPDCLMITNN